MTVTSTSSRLNIVGVAVIVLFGVLFARLWFLQVGSSAEYAAQAERSRVRVTRDAAVRGAIVDRNGRVLVQNALVDTITVQRGLTRGERKISVQNLARVLALSPKVIDAELDDPKYSAYAPVPVAETASFDTLSFILERPELFPGVAVERRSIRDYPNRLAFDDQPPVGAHLLGYVASINQDEYRLRRRAGYTPSDLIGKEGVEQLFESELRGKPRERQLEVDSRGRVVGQTEVTPPEAGHDIELTIDLDVQRVAEESLRQGMDSARGYRDESGQQFRATGGAVVVLDAQNGDIVALASAPTFDIAKFTTGIPVEDFTQLSDPRSGLPLINRAVTGLYAPGSTFKTFSLYSALRDKPSTDDGTVFDESFTFYDRGFIEFGAVGDEVEFRNAGRSANGVVDVTRAMIVSSDVFWYNIGLLYWRTWGRGEAAQSSTNLAEPQYGIQRTAIAFGFGEPTGIGLPGEPQGRVPDLTFKRAVNRGNPDRSTQIWLPGDAMNLAVGQGDLLVTPLQLASAYGAFANGGTLHTPRLAGAVLEGGSTLGEPERIRELPVQPGRRVGVDQSIIDSIVPGLEGAVCSPEGTANGAFRDYECGQVMGKTGTAEVPAKQDTALFVGVSPPRVDPASPQPQYVVAVVVEQGGFGGSVAAPIARRVFDTLRGDPNPPAVRTYPTNVD